MKEIQELISIIERLLAPDGCPWDREQTLQSMRGCLLEETYEVIEAINLDDNFKIEEELGDLLFNVLFLGKLAEKEHRFFIENVAQHIVAKLIRRHPHVFGEATANNSEEVLKQWEEIKQKEKPTAQTNLFSTIPINLPALIRAQKMVKKLKKAGVSLTSLIPTQDVSEEQALVNTLFELVIQAEQKNIDIEQALSHFLTQAQNQFET